MIDHKYIPLLSKISIEAMNAQEFKAHVTSLFWKPEKKRKSVVKKKDFSFRVTKKGSLTVRINRESKVLSKSEVESIATGSGKSIEDVLKYIEKTKGKILTDYSVDAPENNSQISLLI